MVDCFLMRNMDGKYSLQSSMPVHLFNEDRCMKVSSSQNFMRCHNLQKKLTLCPLTLRTNQKIYVSNLKCLILSIQLVEITSIMEKQLKTVADLPIIMVLEGLPNSGHSPKSIISTQLFLYLYTRSIFYKINGKQ